MTTNLDTIKQLVDRTNSKFSTTLQFIMTTSEQRIQLRDPLQLDQSLSYQIGLILFSVFNMPQLINATNNQFRYSKDSGANWTTFSVNPGAYSYTDLNAYIEGELTTNGDWVAGAIVIGVDLPSGRFTLSLGSGYQVDFTIANSLRTILGFNSRIVTTSSTGDTVGNIEGGVNTINITTDISNGGYITDDNGVLVQRGIIYSIPFLAVPIGEKMIVSPQTPIYYPLNQYNVQSIYIRIVDESDRLISFGGQSITVILRIKQV